MKPQCSLDGCDRPSFLGFLCKADRAILTRRLAELPSDYNDLMASLARLDNLGERSAASSVNNPLIINEDAANLHADLSRSLRWIVRHLVILGQKTPCQCRHAHTAHATRIPFVRHCWWRNCRCIGYTPAAEFSIVGMAQWLERRVHVIVLDPSAGEILDALIGLRVRITKQIDQPEDLRTFPIGPCFQLDDKATPCPGEIRAHIPHENSGKEAVARCNVCGVTYKTTQWRTIGRIIKPRPRSAVRDLPEVLPGSARGGRAALTTSDNDDDAVAGVTTTDHARKLNEGLIS